MSSALGRFPRLTGPLLGPYFVIKEFLVNIVNSLLFCLLIGVVPVLSSPAS